MREYNDYIALTRRHLKNYNLFKISVENMREELSLLGKELSAHAELPPMISKYGDEPRGGSPELNCVEMATAKRMETEEKYCMLEREVKRVTIKLGQIDRAITQLPDIEQRLIKGFYFNKASWEELGDEEGYSEKWARDRGGLALKKVAIMLFGLKAAPQQTRFVFAS